MHSTCENGILNGLFAIFRKEVSEVGDRGTNKTREDISGRVSVGTQCQSRYCCTNI